MQEEVNSQQPEEVNSQQSAVDSQDSGEIKNQKSKITNLLDLSTPERVVALRSPARQDSAGGGEKKIIHIFSPPTADDWIEYERMLRPTVIFSRESIETRLAIEKASDALWRRRILRVEGYPFDATANWKEQIPLQHRRMAVAGLDQVQAADDQDILGDSETVGVRLVARWNGTVYEHLVHRFRRPGIEHELRFREATSRRALTGRRLGGLKRPQDEPIEQITLPSLPTLVALYDELIVAVEGYRVPSPDSRVANLMDVPHKAAAVRALLAREEVELLPLEEKAAGEKYDA
jgi:hypothetical protein